MKKCKKLLIIFICLALLMTMVPLNAFAEDTRIPVSKIVATSDNIATPVVGQKIAWPDFPDFKVIEGDPAYFKMGPTYWQKKNDEGVWENVSSGNFSEGTWRFTAKVCIDGASGTTHVLKSPLNVTVNDKKWQEIQEILTFPNSSLAIFASPEYTLKGSPVTGYTVSFDRNGGSGSMADVTDVSGEYTLPANGFTPPKDKKFKGWATSADGAVIEDSKYNVTENTTFYAIWEDIPEDELKLLVTNIAVTVNTPKLGEKVDESQLKFTSTPKDAVRKAEVNWLKIKVEDYTGAEADGWTPMADGEVFEKGYYYLFGISFQPEDGYDMSEHMTGTINGAPHDAFLTPLYISADLAMVTHKFGPLSEEYTVTVTTDENGTASASPPSGATGTEVTLSATPKSGYIFKEWQIISGGVSIVDNKFKIGAENVEVKAVWEKASSLPGFSYAPMDELRKAKEEALAFITDALKAQNFSDEEQTKVVEIKKNFDEKLAKANTVDEVKKLQKETISEIDALMSDDEKSLKLKVESIGSEDLIAKSKAIKTKNGVKAVRISWNKIKGMDFDGYEVYRTTKKMKFGETPFFKTPNAVKRSYINTKNLKKGNTYYYTVKAFKIINGEKVYTKSSTITWRTMSR